MKLGLEGVVVRRGGRTDLEETSLELHPGHLAAIVGGDGAGKTTALSTLAGAIPPSSGRVHAPPRGRTGYVSAGPGVYPDLTVDENLRFAAACYGVRGPALEARLEELLEVTTLNPARRRLTRQLSGGMRQKLAFACAVVHAPDLLVMDEPTTGVDPVSRAELWRLVTTELAAGTTAVFSTTYVDEAARADQVLVLDRGRALAAGSPEQIRASVPGRVVALAGAPGDLPSWRRGRSRHAWVAPDVGARTALPAGAVPVDPDLEDAVVVAALSRQTARTAEVTA